MDMEEHPVALALVRAERPTLDESLISSDPAHQEIWAKALHDAQVFFAMLKAALNVLHAPADEPAPVPAASDAVETSRRSRSTKNESSSV